MLDSPWNGSRIIFRHLEGIAMQSPVRSTLEALPIMRSDADFVAVGGESAGGGTVLQLLAADDGVEPAIFRDAQVSSPYLPPLGYCNSTFRMVSTLPARRQVHTVS